MKKLILILLLLPKFGLSQNEVLIQNNWYLSELVLNGVSYFPPSDSTMPNVMLSFVEENQYTSLVTTACNTLTTGEVLFGESWLAYPTVSVTLTTCPNPSNNGFDGLYIMYFVNQTVFEFTITESEENLMLVLTDANGNLAIYNSNTLGLESPQKSLAELWPNPTSETLNISVSTEDKNIEFRILNLVGQSILNGYFEKSQKQIDVSELPTGTYILEITVQGIKKYSKFIKK